MNQVVPSWSKFEPSWAKLGPSGSQVGQVGAKWGPSGAEWGSSWAKLEPSGGQAGPSGGQVGPSWSQVEPSWGLIVVNLDAKRHLEAKKSLLGRSAENTVPVHQNWGSGAPEFGFLEVRRALESSWRALGGQFEGLRGPFGVQVAPGVHRNTPGQGPRTPRRPEVEPNLAELRLAVLSGRQECRTSCQNIR